MKYNRGFGIKKFIIVFLRAC